ncbi:hypothetical protein Godav_015172, partial [Gossypium davidsonii]|nr:hypothetical protein [Gossypium davidsonii]
DGSGITGFTIISGKVFVYQSLLGKVPEKFEGGWISMNWLKDNFNELPKDLEDRTDELGVCRIVYVILGDVLGHATKCGINRWLSAPTAIVGVVATTVSTSQGDRPIYVPVSNENHGPSYVGLPEYLKDIRLLLDQCSKASVSQSADVRCKGIVGSVRNGGNARNKSGIAVFWVKTTNFVAIARPEGAAQCGHAEEGQHRLVGAAQRAHRGMGSRGVGKFGRRGHEDRFNILGGDAIARRGRHLLRQKMCRLWLRNIRVTS